MADSNLASLALAKETTMGTSPTNGYRELRITGESLTTEKETVVSEEIRSDRQVSDLIKVHRQASGDVEFEASVFQLAQFLELALQNEWELKEYSGELTFKKTAQTIKATTAGAFNGLKVGSIIKIWGAGIAKNNGWKRIVKIIDGETLKVQAGGVDANETVTCNARVNTIRNGVKRQSATLEKRLVAPDGSKNYQLFSGMVADKLSLKLESKAIITGTISFLGLNGAKNDTSIDTDGYEQPFVGDVLNGTSNIGAIQLDGQEAVERFKSLNIDIANNLRGKDALGVEGNFDVGMGKSDVTGSLSAYFRNNDFLKTIDDHSDVSIAFSVFDAEGNGVSVFLPRVKFTTGSGNVEGIDSDVMVNTDYQAILDPVTGAQIIVDIHQND